MITQELKTSWLLEEMSFLETFHLWERFVFYLVKIIEFLQVFILAPY